MHHIKLNIKHFALKFHSKFWQGSRTFKVSSKQTRVSLL